MQNFKLELHIVTYLRNAAAKISYFLWDTLYRLTVGSLHPINMLFVYKYRNKFIPNSVLHISRMVHIPYNTVQLLRKKGIKADYMAIGTNPAWNKCDFHVKYSLIPFVRLLQEMYWVWHVASRYQIIHSHFMVTVSYSGWELPLLKMMNRRIVIHFRGCDIRKRKKNMELYPQINICQKCDYYIRYENKYGCEVRRMDARRAMVKKYGDIFLVTTPDLKDFMPKAVYLPLFAPDVIVPKRRVDNEFGQRIMNIVHMTNHPGIEGTDEIETVIERLKKDGFAVNFKRFSGIPYDKALEEYTNADLSIGKLKMGYYANAQIESMYCGTPAITFVEARFIIEELRDSGFIFSSIKDLRQTIEHLLKNPEEIARKRAIARESITQLHNNEVLTRRLLDIYDVLGKK